MKSGEFVGALQDLIKRAEGYDRLCRMVSRVRYYHESDEQTLERVLKFYNDVYATMRTIGADVPDSMIDDRWSYRDWVIIEEMKKLVPNLVTAVAARAAEIAKVDSAPDGEKLNQGQDK